MGRPRSITDEQILEAARAVFLAQGPAAPAAAVAARAGVSEATIFKRFSSKEALFFAAMGIDETPGWVKLTLELRGAGDPQENLRRIAREMHAFFRQVIPRTLMLWSSRLRPESCFSGGPDAPPARGVRALSEWFEDEIRRGRIAEVDAPIAAHAVVGMVSHLVFFEVMGMDQGAADPRRGDGRVDAFVDALWCGLAPRKLPAGAPKRAPAARQKQRPAAPARERARRGAR